MAAVDYPAEIRALIGQLKRLPGVGPKSAERIALWMLGPGRAHTEDTATALVDAAQSVISCPECGFFTSGDTPCPLCSDPLRDPALLCIVEQATDILPLERTGVFRGQYHVLGGRLSPLDNIGPEELTIGRLLQRIEEGAVTEIILATGSDVEGEATANYLATLLADKVEKKSRLAQGLPAGGGLESADALTLQRALDGRRGV